MPNALTIFCTIFALQFFEEALKLATTSHEFRVSCNIRVVNFLRDAFCVHFSSSVAPKNVPCNTSVSNGSRLHNRVALKHFAVNRPVWHILKIATLSWEKKKTSSRNSLSKTSGAFHSTQFRKLHVPNGTVHSGGRVATTGNTSLFAGYRAFGYCSC